MANRGNSEEGVDPTAATLHVPETSKPVDPSKQLTLIDKKPKQYSGAQKHPKPVELTASAGGAIASHEFLQRYTAGKRLGEGSMGEVIATRDTRILRNVAMKRLHPEHHSARPDLRDRFLREARIQGQLEHPSVVPVYDL
jgi:serine/threonine protein kinase